MESVRVHVCDSGLHARWCSVERHREGGSHSVEGRQCHLVILNSFSNSNIDAGNMELLSVQVRRDPARDNAVQPHLYPCVKIAKE